MRNIRAVVGFSIRGGDCTVILKRDTCAEPCSSCPKPKILGFRFRAQGFNKPGSPSPCPQNTLILNMGAPGKGVPNFWKPPYKPLRGSTTPVILENVKPYGLPSCGTPEAFMKRFEPQTLNPKPRTPRAFTLNSQS